MAFDVLVVLLVVVAAVLGYQRGAIVAAAGPLILIVGALLGGVVGSLFSPVAVMPGVLGGIALASVVTASLGRGIATRIHDRIPDDWRGVDRMLGIFIGSMGALTLVWLVSAIAVVVPTATGPIAMVRSSTTADVLTNLLPPTGPVASRVLRSGAFPALSGPVVLVGEPNDLVLAEPAVRAAEASVFQIRGRACSSISTGTGWVASPGIVVTNAHVVAGMRSPAVIDAGGIGRAVPASVRYFDPANDLAVLSAPTLDAPSLQMADTLVEGADAAIIGFPRLEGMVTTPARFDREVTWPTTDIYNRTTPPLRIALFRGDARPGNSGSPLLDADGRVLGTIEAHALDQAIEGGFAVSNDVTRVALARLSRTVVSSGPCIAPPSATS